MLEAAIDVFAAEGYHGGGMRAIAERADVSPSTVYHYFGNKRNLFLASFHRAVDDVWEQLRASVAGLASVVEEIEHMLCTGAWIMQHRPELTTISIRAQIDLTSEEIKEAAERSSVSTLVHEITHRAVQRGELAPEDKFQFAMTLHTAIWGLSMMGRHGNVIRDTSIRAVGRLVSGTLLRSG